MRARSGSRSRGARGMLAAMRTMLALAATLVLACSTPPKTDSGGAATGGSTTPGTTTPPDRSPGMTTTDPASSQALEPRDALLSWLDAHGGTPDIGAAPVLKLPVTITWGDQRLTLAGATLGGEGGLALKLDDTALGISLKDRARNKCPKDSPSCRILIEGRWRGLEGEVGTIQVTRFVSVIADGQPGDRVELAPAT